MAALSSFALIGGLALSGAGAVVQYEGMQKAAQAQRRAIQAEQQAEAIRQQQMNLEAQRQKRQIIRQGILARSQAEAQATGQGAQFGTLLPGAQAAITGQTGYNQLGVSEAQSLGNSMFDVNQQIFQARRQEADAQTMAGIGQGLSSLGGALTKNLGPIGRIGGNYGF